MTLFRQIIVAVIILIIAFYSVNALVNISNSRMLVEQQMQVHAQDTATSLALSVAQAAEAKDYALVETLVSVVSDSGYFQRIYLRNTDGEILIDQHFPVEIEGVPGWFIGSIKLTENEGKAEVMSASWTILGELVVISHPGQAYLQLWRIVKTQLLWFVAVMAISCLLVYWVLRKLLEPLARVEIQANAIADGDFAVQKDLPKSPELHSVVQAMNQMSDKLRQSFGDQFELINRLHEQAAIDEVTGLSNRADFDAQIAAYVGEEEGNHAGLLAIVAVDGLSEINQLSGRKEGNAFLKAIADAIQRQLVEYPRAIISRRQGAEFTVFVPDIDRINADNLAIELFDLLKSLRWGQTGIQTPSYTMGYVFEEVVSSISNLLTCADMALTRATLSGRNSCQNFAAMDLGVVPVLNEGHGLQDILYQAIANESILLHFQPVFHIPDGLLVANEVYIRFPGGDHVLGATALMPVAEKLGYAATLDKLVLQKAAAAYASRNLTQSIRVNLSVDTLVSDDFCEWMETFLLANPDFAPALLIEIKESALRNETETVAQLNGVLNKYKAGLCIDNFGQEASSFAYLARLKLHSLKVYRSFCRDLENNTDNQFYISSLADLAHNLNIQLYVEGVETQQVWDKLLELNVDGCQGYFLGEPTGEPVSGS